MEDIRLCAVVGLVPDQRRRLKHQLGLLGRDFLATTAAFSTECTELTSGIELYTIAGRLLVSLGGNNQEYAYYKFQSDRETFVLTCTNVRELITQRIRRLQEHDRLVRAGVHDTLRLCVVGDYGADYTKLGLLIGNVQKPGSSANFSLIGCYPGELI